MPASEATTTIDWGLVPLRPAVPRRDPDYDTAWSVVGDDEDDYAFEPFECEPAHGCDCPTCVAGRENERSANIPNNYTSLYRSYRKLGDGGEYLNPDFTPEFRLLQGEDGPNLAQALQSAFTFFRRHGDRRYSAQSLMKLVSYADKVNEAWQNGDVLADSPAVVIAELPYSYDEETEVKSGGIIGMAVMFDDLRTLVAVHTDKRRVRIGQTLMMALARTYTNIVAWVHRDNAPGVHFSTACGLTPWTINGAGAVQFARFAPMVESDAAAHVEDYEIDDELRRYHRTNRRRH